jgi:hypothetical protein
MAYLSEENTEMYRRMLSADTEQGPGTGAMFNPPPKTAAPTTVGGFVRKTFPAPGPVITKQITVTGTTTASSGGVTTEIAPMPKTFQQGAAAMTMAPTKTNFMPLVYIGGAGLLLYFLFVKK